MSDVISDLCPECILCDWRNIICANTTLPTLFGLHIHDHYCTYNIQCNSKPVILFLCLYALCFKSFIVVMCILLSLYYRFRKINRQKKAQRCNYCQQLYNNCQRVKRPYSLSYRQEQLIFAVYVFLNCNVLSNLLLLKKILSE